MSGRYFIRAGSGPRDPWSSQGQSVVDSEKLTQLRRGRLPDVQDVDAAEDLFSLVMDDLGAFGTSGGETMTNVEMRDALTALKAVSDRIGIKVDVPFRDLTTFRSYWIRKDCANSWQARRDLIGSIFDDPYAKVVAAQDRALASTLAGPISPHEVTGWPRVDTEIEALRAHFRDAITPQDCRAVGLDAVAVLEALSATAYRHDVHGDAGADEPPVTSTKDRLDRVVTTTLPGSKNAELRSLVRSSIAAAQRVKHSTPTRTEAGLAGDAVILVANMIRRLVDE